MSVPVFGHRIAFTASERVSHRVLGGCVRIVRTEWPAKRVPVVLSRVHPDRLSFGTVLALAAIARPELRPRRGRCRSSTTVVLASLRTKTPPSLCRREPIDEATRASGSRIRSPLCQNERKIADPRYADVLYVLVPSVRIRVVHERRALRCHSASLNRHC